MTEVQDNSPKRTDFFLMALAVILTVIGLLLVFDSSYTMALQHNLAPTKYFEPQAIFAALGIGVMFWASRVRYWKWKSVAGIGVLGSVILLSMVWVPHIGITAKGAHRWVGHGFATLQPSELAKLALILYIARSCANHMNKMGRFFQGPGPGIAITLALAFLVAREPDLGTAVVIIGTGLTGLFFAGMKFRHMAVIAVLVVVLAGAAVLMKSHKGGNHYQLDRIMVFMHPDAQKQGEGYQVYHSILAISTGGLTGMGIGQGREKLYLPEANTDFIFAVLGEEGGFAATMTLLLLLGLLVARGMHIACTTQDPFGAILAASISACLGIQAFINIAVVTATIPATGVPLPFTSDGGSSLIMSLLMVGILLSIGRYPNGDPTRLRYPHLTKPARDFENRWQRGVPPAVPSYKPKPMRDPVVS